MKNIFLINSNRGVEPLQVLKKGLNSNICGVITYEPWTYPEWLSENTGIETWGWEKIANERFPVEIDNKELYVRLVGAMTTDPNVFFLFDRHYGIGGHKSSFNVIVTVERLVWNSTAILEHAQPDVVFALDVPHNPVSYIFSRVSEISGCELMFYNRSPLYHKNWVLSGVREMIPVRVGRKNVKLMSEAGRKIFDKFNSDYSIGIPRDDKDLIAGSEENGNVIWLLKSKLMSLRARLKKMVKSRIYGSIGPDDMKKHYINLAKKGDLDKVRYYCFFLHSQPEANTLPMGGFYSQQLIAVVQLRLAMPVDVILYVREHPATFKKRYRPTFRSREFYNSIIELPGVELLNFDQDPFEIIDKSECIATITGTVGMQALARGKQVIVFGNARYRHYDGAFWVKNYGDLKGVLNEIGNPESMPSESNFSEVTALIESISYGDCRIHEDEAVIEYHKKLVLEALKDLDANDWEHELIFPS